MPIYAARNRLIREIQQHDSVVVIGETGSGKTTQIPQVICLLLVAQSLVVFVSLCVRACVCVQSWLLVTDG